MSQNESFRVLDACANRAAEGLRTIEDVARLVREDAWAAAQLKSLRHELGRVVDCLPRMERLAARCTHTDAGTGLLGSAENQRADWQSIVSAASERVAQSLRSLEEFSKIFDPNIALQFKQLRYRAYDSLAEIEIRFRETRNIQSARLYVLIDCHKPIDEFAQYLRQLATAGVDWFQLREKKLDDCQFLKYARAAVDALQGLSASVIINDRPDIALLSGAAGVHVGQDDLPIEQVRRLVGHKLLVGVSTHSIQQLLEAQDRGADYVGCGPTFPSRTKCFSEYPGLEFIQQATGLARVPAFAIGGIDAENMAEVIAAGCNRIAVSACVHAASDPVLAATLLANCLRGITCTRISYESGEATIEETRAATVHPHVT